MYKESDVRKTDEILRKAYYDLDSGVGFGGLQALQRYGRKFGISPSDTQKWLLKQKHYRKFQPVRRSFRRKQTFVNGLDEQWQGDLADMQKWSKQNRGYRYILFCIDILSRYVFAEPLKSKDYVDVIRGFKSILDKSGRKPFRLQTDQGTEFLGAHFQAYLKSLGIDHFYTHQETKSAVVERVIRTIMGKIWQAMDSQETRKWIDLLQPAVRGYNRSTHRSIGIAPSQVGYANSQDVWRYLYHKSKEVPPPSSSQNVGKLEQSVLPKEGEGEKKAAKKGVKKKGPLFKVGDPVWIYNKKAYKNAFEKGYKSKWLTDEIFIVKRVLGQEPPYTYKLENQQGEIVPGQFYESQIQLAEP